jgi:hypothetical protein
VVHPVLLVGLVQQVRQVYLALLVLQVLLVQLVFLVLLALLVLLVFKVPRVRQVLVLRVPLERKVRPVVRPVLLVHRAQLVLVRQVFKVHQVVEERVV